MIQTVTANTLYRQLHVDMNRWDTARTKTRASTIQNGMVFITANKVAAISAGDTILASAPIERVTAGINGLAGLASGIMLSFPDGKWLIDFGYFHARTANTRVSRYVQLFNPLSGFTSFKLGKEFRAQFVRAFTEAGGHVSD